MFEITLPGHVESATTALVQQDSRQQKAPVELKGELPTQTQNHSKYKLENVKGKFAFQLIECPQNQIID